jgi:BASS family bile acid:Na+ symporter
LALVIVLHNAIGLVSGYGLSRLFGFDKRVAKTVAIEVGMQNSGLSVALALKYFGAVSALPGALFSVWHNISGSMLAAYWQKKDEASKSS